MMNPPDAGTKLSPAEVARNEHIYKFAHLDEARRAAQVAAEPNKTPLSPLAELALRMSSKGAAFTNWQKKTTEYNTVVHKTAQLGSTAGIGLRNSALYNARLGRIEYLAPLAMAVSSVGKVKGAPLLTPEEWDLLASYKDSSINDLSDDARHKAVEKFKKDNYGQFEDMFNEDQFGRAKALAEAKHSFTTRAANFVGGLFGYGEKTEGEKMLTKTTKEEARHVLEEMAKDDAAFKVNKTINELIVTDKTFAANKTAQAEKREALLKKEEAAELEKINDTNIESKMEEMNATKETTRIQVESDKKAYTAEVSTLMLGLETSMQLLNVAKADIVTCNSAETDTAKKLNEEQVSGVDDTVKAVSTELEKAILNDYHYHARNYESQYEGATKKSRYGSEDAPLSAKQDHISKEHTDKLGALGENKDKMDEKGNKKDGKTLTVNGIPCEKVGLIDMYKMDFGFSFMGMKFGGKNRTKHIGKLFEAWMVESTAANQADFQKLNPGRKLTVAEMMKAYATGKEITVMEGDPPKEKKVDNLNMHNGSPVNMLRISSFNVRGGVETTLRAFMEMQVMAEILGIALHIDTGMILQNSDDQRIAGLVKYAWEDHYKMTELNPYFIAARKRIDEQFDLVNLTPEMKKAKLMRTLVGNEMDVSTAGMEISALSQRQEVGGNVTGEKSKSSTEKLPTTEITSAEGSGLAETKTPSAVPTPPVPPTVTLHTNKIN